MDRGWTDRRLACRAGDEGGRLRCSGGHHSRHPRRPCGRVDLRALGNLAGRRDDRLHHLGLRWRGDFGLAYPLDQESLSGAFGKQSRLKQMIERKFTIAEIALLAVTRIALGAGIGLLLSTRLNNDQRKAAGWALALVGGLTTIPLAWGVIGKKSLEKSS